MKRTACTILLCLLIAMPINAMENKKKSDLTEITVIIDPKSAHYLDVHTIVVSGSDSCSIIDAFHSKEIKQIVSPKECTNYLFSTTTHPHKKMIALGYDDKITIYNTETDAFIWRKTISDHGYINFAAFSPFEEALFVKQGNFQIIKYNYLTDTQESMYESESLYHFALHPHKKNILITKRSADLCIHDSDDLTKQITTTKDKSSYNLCEYSADGTTLAVGNQCGIHIKSSDLQKEEFIIDTAGKFKQIKFYREKLILALLSSEIKDEKEYYAMEYCDIKNKLIIHTTHLEFDPIWDFDFSPDGKKILFVADYKCIIMPLPIELFKEDIFMYWILKHYQKNNSEVEIPYDIIQYIFSLFFKQ